MYARFKYIPRPTPFPTPPATVIGVGQPGQKVKGDPLTLSTRLETAVRQRNTLQAGGYVFKQASGWVNNFNGAGRAVVERVGFGGNVTAVLERAPGYLLLDALKSGDPVPANDDILHWHRFTCVNYITGQPRQPGKGFDAWVLFISEGPFWVQEANVELFSEMPAPRWPGAGAVPTGWAGKIVSNTIIRQQPRAGSNKVGLAYAGMPVIVREELLGWAKIDERRWVQLGMVRRL